jgi:hypothetical protein
MSELPDNWEEIKSDKAFWDEVKRMIAADVLHEAQYYEEATKRLTSGAEAEFDEEEYSAEEYDYELHELAIAAVLNSKNVFSVFYNDQYGEDNSSSVNELAGKFYVADWSDPKMVIGPNDTIEDAATVILSCYNDGTFTDAASNLPIDQMLKLCEQAVPMGGEFRVNGVKYVMTKDGLVPA